MHLPLFIEKDAVDENPVVTHLLARGNYQGFRANVEALKKARSIIITCSMLHARCRSLDEALVVAVLDRLRSDTRMPLEAGASLATVQESNLTFFQLCHGLTVDHGAAVIVLDDLPGLFNAPKYTHWWDQHDEGSIVARERAVMSCVNDVVLQTLPLPGLILYLTGRSPALTYKLLTEVRISPLFVHPVLFDALQHEHVVELIMKSEANGTPLVSELGVSSPADVHALAQFLISYTGGVARVVTGALEVLALRGWLRDRQRGPALGAAGPSKPIEAMDFLRSAMRRGLRLLGLPPRPGTVTSSECRSVADTLRAHAGELERELRTRIVFGISPNWSVYSAAGWDRRLTQQALYVVLQRCRADMELDAELRVRVADGGCAGGTAFVTAVDLLSVLGVPYELKGRYLEVKLGIFMINALREEDGAWTAEQAEQLKTWSTALALEAGREIVLAGARAAGSAAVAGSAAAVV